MIDLQTLIQMVLEKMNAIDLGKERDSSEPRVDISDPLFKQSGFLRYAREVRDQANDLLPTLTDSDLMLLVNGIYNCLDLELDLNDPHTYQNMFREIQMRLTTIELQLEDK